MGRCISGTLLGLFVMLFMFGLILLISRTVFLHSFVASGTVVPPNLRKTVCNLISSRTEICRHKSWVTVWTLGPLNVSPSKTDSAIVSPFHSRNTFKDAENDARKYPINRTYACFCPIVTGNHTYSTLCNFDQACMLDVEEVEFLQQEAERYSYAGRILVAVGVMLVFISVGGIVTVAISVYCNSHDGYASDQYQEYVVNKESHFTLGDEDNPE